ncbi:hypothetical protein ZYGR_0H01640 [Zygosaccharomyces rouxii]|uniref:ZYRO0B07810p n=2 Tax=Zygosaccharomyces rouxii TaxID=4956 RepID=C5DRE4_ZYGRC|nr:uncharacterized protein ZYRO0B07810g [Zygosaccharomyces rouxii]KAH9200103.1 Septin-domain-containing protein [Zygosaccharomyces rouxii]GAV47323.1 hypothetical protein ZYGR_0H01640 [Zygosaccharomyces rouxii]CAR26355.1 ZYRO0B07810p [Zygosaccharomyces rouxii]
MSLDLSMVVSEKPIDADEQEENFQPEEINEIIIEPNDDFPDYSPPATPTEDINQDPTESESESEESESLSDQDDVGFTVEEPEEESEENDQPIESGSEQHVLVMSTDLLPKEEQEPDEKDVSSPSERTDVSSNPGSTSHSVNVCLPSMETLVVDVPNRVAGYETGISNLPTQRERMVARDGVKFNFMVSGQAGLGKTTFVNTLFDTCLLPSNRVTRDVKTVETRCLEIHRAVLETADVKLDLNIIDTPGFGYKSNSTFDWVPLINYIDEQIRSYIFQEEQPNRSNLRDDRVHCCLYFVEPTGKGLNALDVIAMRELSKRVNLIPIIAKADGLSKEELCAFKREIRNVMHAQDIKVCQFLEEDNAFYSDIFEMAPFAVVGSEMKIIGQDGEPLHVRKYRWGTVEVENVDHCDFTLLKNVLISNHLVDFVRTTESYCETCRSSILKTRILKARDSIDNADFPVELRDELQKLNYDELDLNGLKNYVCYSVFGKKDMDVLVVEWSPEFVQRRWESRKRFNEVITLEDQKFQEWKMALQNKQVKFNQELELLSRNIDDLQLECHDLETQIMAAKAVQRTRSKLGTISRGEKRAAA